MKRAKNSNATIQRQRMLVVLPLLAFPFLTFTFWILGGGSLTATGDKQEEKAAGLNVQLPDPSRQKEIMMDKLGFYDAAARDSIKRAQLLKNDPYAQWKENNSKTPGKNEGQTIAETTDGKYHRLNNSTDRSIETGDAEQRLVSKMNELNRVINTAQPAQNKSSTGHEVKNNLNTGNTENTQKLEQLMRQLNQKENTSEHFKDPEVEQLNALMDKVMAIQHPETSTTKSNDVENNRFAKENILLVSDQKTTDSIQRGFYGLNTTNDLNNRNRSNTIEASIPENQTLVNGATIKLRLSQDLYIKSVRIPAGNFLWGKVYLSGERLNVAIDKIAYDHSLYPVRMEVYNTDGLPGIYIPGSITSDAMKQSADNSLQLMQLGSYDPSIGAQAVVAGIGAARNLISKRVKLVKVMVRAGYKILLTNKTNG